VEPDISKDKRKEVRKRCKDAGVAIWGPGSACEFHSPDKSVVEKNIELTKRFIELAHDLGGKGVKVRPNGFPKDVSREKTIEQIGRALRRCGEAATGSGVRLCCEMHGRGTSEPKHMKAMMDIADHPDVGVVWNSNHNVDDKTGSITANFDMLRPKIYHVHTNELICGYPYRELFALLNETGYDGYSMIEARPLKEGNLQDNVRFVRYYKMLWEALSQPAAVPARISRQTERNRKASK
jgi:sugar phosphate isomerase/epimerase